MPFHLHERRDDMILPLEPDVIVSDPVPTEATWGAFVPLYENVAAAVAAADRSQPPVVFTADCCVAVGVLGGLARVDIHPGVVWIDGHGDFNTPDTTISGYLGGMALSAVTGRGDVSAGDGLGVAPVPDERVVLVDARDLDPAESELLDASRLRRVKIEEVGSALRTALATGPIYLHVDLDVLDPAELPGLLFPATGGSTLGALAEATATVAETGRLAAVSIGCTWHPAEADPARCREVVSALLDTLAGG